MVHWIRVEHDGAEKFGTLDNDTITVYQGEMFDSPVPTNERIDAGSAKLLTPTKASKMVCLWNNFGMLAAKLNLATPEEPLYFLKSTTAFLPGGGTIRKPPSYDGKVIFEGELGIVIGKECCGVSERDAPDYIFGYTCVNDVTAIELLNKDSSFAQWTRAKSFDTFGVFGPVVATDLDPDNLVVKSILNGSERQNYPVSDMTFRPFRLVSMISQDMRLLPGDVIACGTNVGVGSMRPGSTIEISIEGVGVLANTYG
jgi:2-keto-4-pentenoate hydratase/2-oxohepta-3-ene-1,7-dioic acid hydratase in catechol pathway